MENIMIATDYELKDIDPDDISDLLIKVEKSFNIQFESNELMHITTFGQLCDHIAQKIHLDDTKDCTSQQAFYKLRDAISATLHIESTTIYPKVFLKDILPRQTRRAKTKEIEAYLGVKLDLLRPPHWITGTLLFILLASIAGLFFNWQIGLLAVVFSIFGFWIASKIGNELNIQTVGQLANKMTRENYLKSRRNPKTVNKNEIETVLTDLFSEGLDLDRSKLTRESKFV